MLVSDKRSHLSETNINDLHYSVSSFSESGEIV